MSYSRPLPLPIIPTLRAPPASETIIRADTIIIDSQNTKFGWPLITLNTNETSTTGASAPSGISIYRGPNQPAVNLTWDETVGAFTADGSIIGTIESGNPVGILRWNGSKFTLSGTAFVNSLNQDVSTDGTPSFQSLAVSGQIEANSVAYTFPNSQGSNATVLTNDGSGNLSWQTPGSIIVSGSSITNSTNTARVETLNDNTIETTILGNAVMTQTSLSATAATNFKFQKGITFVPTVVTSSYNMLQTDTLVIYKGNANATITLPQIQVNECKLVVIENKSSYSITVQPYGSDFIDGNSSPFTFDGTDPNATMLMSDGDGNWISI